MLYYDAVIKNIVHFDGRETPPFAATGEIFILMLSHHQVIKGSFKVCSVVNQLVFEAP
jgi:hypothetical protein